MPSLENRVSIVTGGASGLGLEICSQLCSAGARVVALDIVESLPEHSSACKNLSLIRCDVTDEKDVEKAVSSVFAEHGQIDVLVNNVGILYSSPLVSLGTSGLQLHDSRMWDKVISTNLSSAFYMAKHVVSYMVKKRTKGVIVNISSISAQGNAGQSAYSAAKAGIESLARVWSKELSPLGIRCFAVAPGFCNTPSTHLALSERVLKDTVSKVPLKRLGETAEIASFVLANIQNDFVNGKVLQIDGGLIV